MTSNDNFKEIPAKYDPSVEELKVVDFWKNSAIFKFDPANLNSDNLKKLYSIDTPPPTVSGKMHIGHSYSYAQQDFIARYKRATGIVFYPFGTDDNGLPTERLVEKLNNVRSKSMSRTDFIKLCQKTLVEITPAFVDDWKRLGVSADYDLCYSTVDQNSQKLSQASFVELAKRGEVYKKEFPSMWCVDCQTAIAQAELEDKEHPSLFSTLKFTVDGEELHIATTRPELLPACVAVFVNPDDDRYKHLVGKKAKTPLFDVEVPIIFDKSAEIGKGTGVLMICSYGDKFDADAIKRHNLKAHVIIDEAGRMKDGKYAGHRVKATRKLVLEDLQNAGLIVEQKSINHVVNVHDKCGTEIEFLPTEQWFIKVLDKKDKLIEQGRKVKWYPEFMIKRYENWVNGLDWDWNISRDRHFGIPIPAWECPSCKKIIYPSVDELPVDPIQVVKICPDCSGNVMAKPETKVLDTWATSSLSPQLSSSLLNNKVKVPFSLRPQAHDIIRTWAFYTITRSLLSDDEIPWKNISVSGFVTLGGEKMSKSKGNVIDPHTVLKSYGADSLRFWAAGCKLGEDLDYQEKDLVAGKKITQKMWNSFKFASFFLNPSVFDKNVVPELTVVDKWMLNEVDGLVVKATEYFESYEFDKAKFLCDQFFWNVFCDNYLEIVKDRLYKPEIYGEDAKKSGQYTLYYSLKTLLQLFQPITPFVTEAVWQYFFRNFGEVESISTAKWPELFDVELTIAEKEAAELALKMTTELRRFKSEKNKSLNTKIDVIVCCDDSVKAQILMVKADVTGTAKIENISFVSSDELSSLRGDVKLSETLAGGEVLDIASTSGEKIEKVGVVFLTMDVEFKEEPVKVKE